MPPEQHTAYIGLGANLGNPHETISAAMILLRGLPISHLTKTSSFYLTAPIEANGDDYVNAVVEICTQLSPTALLAEIQTIEQRFGRVRSYPNAPRTLDCDLLLYDQQIINTPTLQVPHPRMHLRAFVLVPLLEIAPHMAIPNQASLSRLLKSVADQPIQKWTD